MAAYIGNKCFTLPTSFSPSQVNGVVGWYDSNSFIGNSWSDRTLFYNTLTANKSETNVGLGVPFRGDIAFSNNYISFGSQTAGCSIFIVCSLDTSQTADSINNLVTLFGNKSITNSNANITLGYTVNSSAQTFNICTYDGVTNYSAPVYSNISFNSITNSNILLSAFVFTNSATYSSAYFNNILASTTTQPIILNPNSNNRAIQIGEFDRVDINNCNHNLRCTIREILIYNKVLLASEVTYINQYLSIKNSITLNSNGIFTY